MAFQNHPGVLPLLVGGAALWANAGYLLWRTRADRRAPGQLLAAGLIACFAISVTAFALEQAHTDFGPKVFWNQVQYVGDAPLTAFLLGYVLVYVGYDHSWQTYGALFALPIVTIVGVFTNSLHQLYWSSLSLEEVAGYVVLDNGAAPLFYLYILYTYAFLLASLFLLARASVESGGAHRKHLLTIGAGTVLPAGAGIAYVLGLGPTPTPNYPGYAYLGTAAAITYSIHRHDVFDVLPIARRTALEQMDDGVVTLDKEGIVVGANDAARTILDVPRDEIVGRPASEVLGEVAAIDLTDADRESSPSERANRQQTAIETDDRVFDVTVRPLTRGAADVGRLVGLHDVTDRHRREQQLSKLNTRLELALEVTDTGVWEWDLETDEVVWDETSERLYGYDPGEFPGTYEAFADRVVSEALPTVEDRIETAIETSSEYEADFPIQLPDGRRRWIQAHGVVEGESKADEPSRLIGIQTDITDRKEHERELEEKNRKLELLNRIVRHDIRNEASLALNLVRRLERGSVDGDNEHLAGVKQSGERIVSLTETARELIDAVSHFDEDLEPIALVPVLERTVANAADRSTTATVRLEGTIPDVEVWASDALASVFRNLLSNAIQHNDREECEVIVSATQDRGVVRVAVADDGPGIPDEHKESVFQRGRTLAGSDGTGFGLYLVETLVDVYGGTVEVADRDPRGTVVTVSLPLVQEGESEPGP